MKLACSVNFAHQSGTNLHVSFTVYQYYFLSFIFLKINWSIVVSVNIWLSLFSMTSGLKFNLLLKSIYACVIIMKRGANFDTHCKMTTWLYIMIYIYNGPLRETVIMMWAVIKITLILRVTVCRHRRLRVREVKFDETRNKSSTHLLVPQDNMQLQ